MKRWLSTAWSAALVCAGSGAGAAVEGVGTTQRVEARRVPEAPIIDGDLTDPVWAAVPADDRFTQRFPDEGQAPTQRTEMKVAYDDRAVYFAFRLHDTEPDAIVARLTRRDRTVEADSIGVAIDSRHGHNGAYVFFLNAAGVQQDALLSNDTNLDFDWDAVWEGAVRRDSGGWSAELAIPLSVLRFGQADEQEWGLQVRRYISRRQEEIYWTHIPRTVPQLASRMGHLTGLKGLKPPRTFELRPFAVSRVRARTESGGALLGLEGHGRFDADADIGLDLKVGLTSDLTLDATFNPDFGQVEADQVVLNLSRFETFFPEKRPFFLEGKDVFATPVNLFYSRRIGRPPSGLSAGSTAIVRTDAGEVGYEVVDAPTALPIYAAAKLTGKAAGELSVGALSAVTAPEVVRIRLNDAGSEGEAQLSPARGYSVLRLRYDLGSNSYLGLLGTSVLRLGEELRRGSANHDAFAEALDAQWQSRSGVWRLVGQVLTTQRVGGTSHVTDRGTPCADPATQKCFPITRSDGTKLEPGDVGWGANLRAYRRGEHWIGELGYQGYTPTLDPNDLGFLTQFNLHRLDGWSAWQDTSGAGPFQYWSWGAGGTVGMTWDGTLRVAEVGSSVEMQFDNFWFVNLNWGVGFPGGWDIHETGDGARWETSGGAGGGVFAMTDARKAVQVSTGLFGGHGFGALGGWDVSWDANVKLKPISTLEIDLNPRVSWVANAVRSWFAGDACLDDAGEPCTVDTVDRHYVFAELDSGSVSVTLRSTYTFSPTLSLQGYAQLFLSQGEFSRYWRVDTVGTRPFIERDDLVLDPAIDAGDDDFQSGSLNVNLVLRWEPAPGTTLLAVYTRGQAGSYDLTGRRPRFQVSGLDTGPAEDVFLLKLTYFVS